MKIILASASPRRKELLSLIVPEFEIMPSNVEENIEEGLTLNEQAKRLAYIKAKDIFDKTSGNRIIIGSDTIVAKDERIYGKPKSINDAKNMIKELIAGDRVHSVLTSICIIIEQEGKIKEYNDVDEVKVHLTDITDAQIDKWISTGKAMDKAGAYAIQEEFCVFIEKIDGNYSSVVGLPTHKVYEIIKDYI